MTGLNSKLRKLALEHFIHCGHNHGELEDFARKCAALGAMSEREATLKAALVESRGMKNQPIGPQKADYFRGFINGWDSLAGHIQRGFVDE